MKELNPFAITADTPPSYETPEAKWYLIKKTKHYAGWLWESKKEKDNRAFLVTKGDKIVHDCYQLESLFDWLRMLELAYERA